MLILMNSVKQTHFSLLACPVTWESCLFDMRIKEYYLTQNYFIAQGYALPIAKPSSVILTLISLRLLHLLCSSLADNHTSPCLDSSLPNWVSLFYLIFFLILTLRLQAISSQQLLQWPKITGLDFLVLDAVFLLQECYFWHAGVALIPRTTTEKWGLDQTSIWLTVHQATISVLTPALRVPLMTCYYVNLMSCPMYLIPPLHKIL